MDHTLSGNQRTRLALRDADRAFLRDYQNFGLLNHVIAAEAFRRAYEYADEVAGRVREQIERLPAEEAAAMALRLNDGSRVQTVAVARLLSTRLLNSVDV